MSDDDPKVRFTITLEGKRNEERTHLHTLKFILKRLLRAAA